MRGIMQSIRLLILSSLWTLLLIFSAPASKAQDSGRPITAVYALEVGARSALSEYLSPIAYHGVSYAAEGEWSKVMPFAPEKAMMRFEGRVAYASMLNPAGSASMLAVEGRFAWQMAGCRYFSPTGCRCRYSEPSSCPNMERHTMRYGWAITPDSRISVGRGIWPA